MSKPKTKTKSAKREMTFDFDGLIQLLAGHLYSEKKVFIRELIQNAHDAIQRRVVAEPRFDRDQGHIDILTDLTSNPGKIVFRDNGIGMTQDDLETYLSTIGKSGTKAAREEAAKTENALADVIGQFGIGFLSGFVVGGRVEVRTRHFQATESEGCLWENSGRADYTITPIKLPQIGTEVTVYLASAEDRGLLHEDAVKKVIRDYADMLRISIHLNDPNHHLPTINTRVMPWERTGISEDEMRLDAMVYLEKTMPDSVLEAIPIRIKDPKHGNKPALTAEGLLYITRTRVIATDAPRTVRVFLKRMFLCEDAKELLPPWATFVNGIINTGSLSPNAARDNFTRDESFTRLRDRLGDIIVAHFEHLREQELQRLSEILAYHDLAIKAACHYYEPFFHKFGHLLEWRINAKAAAANIAREAAARNAKDRLTRNAKDATARNAKDATARNTAQPAGRRALSEDTGANYSRATLPDILASLPQSRGGGPKKLPCFTTTSSANQFFEMADAAGTTVLDASSHFEGELIRAWADKNRKKVSLVYVDREDDPSVFRETDPTQDRNIVLLARKMSSYIFPGGSGRLRAEARRFEPSSLPAVLKTSETGDGSMKAREILNDPNTPSDLRTMAEEMLRLGRNADMRMSINAANPLIRTLANLVATIEDDPDLNDLMLCVYNDAILYNQELMTPRNAQLFHAQFQRLMDRSVEFIKQKSDIVRERTAIERQRAALQPKKSATNSDRKHLVGFFMTPFADDFKLVREAMRIVVEDKFGCELRTASDKTCEDFIRGNVQANMDDADFFVADVTGANPNVMMELGAAYANPKSRPVLLIARLGVNVKKPDLPADLEGHIAVTYASTSSTQAVAEMLEEGFRKNVRLVALLKAASKERFVSAESLRSWTKNFLSNGVYDRLRSLYPTVSAWRNAKLEDVEKTLGGEGDLASAALKRIKSNLPD